MTRPSVIGRRRRRRTRPPGSPGRSTCVSRPLTTAACTGLRTTFNDHCRAATPTHDRLGRTPAPPSRPCKTHSRATGSRFSPRSILCSPALSVTLLAKRRLPAAAPPTQECSALWDPDLTKDAATGRITLPCAGARQPRDRAAEQRKWGWPLRKSATRVTSTAPPQSGHATGTAAAWVSSTRAGRGRQPWRPYSAPARRPGRPPRPCGRSLANGAACRRPARRASSNCRFRRSTCCFRRSFSRCRRSFLRCSLFASRSRPVSFPWSRSRSLCSSAIRCGGDFRSAVVTPPLWHNSQNCTSQKIDTSARNPLSEDSSSSHRSPTGHGCRRIHGRYRPPVGPTLADSAPFAFESARMAPPITLLLVAGGRERNYG